ncbi:transposase [Streptomyces atratus]|uniref:transposase n=1 Tax=Streptomyces atratus TaxID=1893 RepID=UPI001E4F9B9E|nr:transposase [Streptomyces atratus]
MAEKRRKFTAEFREGAVRIGTETGKPVPEVAQNRGTNETPWRAGCRGQSGPRRPRRRAKTR